MLLSLEEKVELLVVWVKDGVHGPPESLGGIFRYQDRGYGRKRVPFPVHSESPRERSHSNWCAATLRGGKRLRILRQIRPLFLQKPQNMAAELEEMEMEMLAGVAEGPEEEIADGLNPATPGR